MSYNIRYGSLGIDGVIETIRSERPDVVCVQESLAKGRFPDPTPRLKAAFDDYHFARYGELLVLSRYPILRQRQHSLPRRNGSGVLEAKLNVNGKAWTVLCVHFMNPIDKEMLHTPSDITRRAAVRHEQFHLMKYLAQKRKTPVIIAGDFNTPSRGYVYRQLKSNFSDAYATYGFGFGATFPALLPIERIDHIWIANGAKAESLKVLSCGDGCISAVFALVLLRHYGLIRSTPITK